MSEILKTACLQMSSGPVIADNMKTFEAMVREAAGQDAKLIASPENTCHIRAKSSDKFETAFAEQDHPFIPLASALAKELGVFILVGSLSVKTGDRLANRSMLFGPDGARLASYDKIHLFDVDLPTGEKHRESDVFRGGGTMALADLNGVKLGLTICYDLRFAYLFRALAKSGADIIAVPSAFTVPTGEAHWEVLLRARAIETGSYIIAPAQTGGHEGGRRTWGHSLIIDPWGRILAQAGSETGIIYADINPDEVRKARAAIPALKHDRSY